MESIQESARSLAPWNCEYRYWLKDGGFRWLHGNASPSREANGGILWHGFITDITQRKATQLRLEMALDAAEQGLWDWNIATDETFFDDRYLRMLGYDPGDLAMTSEAWADIVHPEDLPQVERALHLHFRGDTDRYRAEFRCRNKRGQYQWIQSVGRVVEWGKSNVPMRMLGMHLDIQESREQAEALRVATERAESSSRTKSEFLANMSHEIRTPLTAILGNAELLLEERDLVKAPPHRIETIQTIRRSGDHLLAIINDILDLSKIEAGRMELERIETDLPQTILGVMAMLRPRAEIKGLSLDVVTKTPIFERVHCDPTRLRQILVNLVGNAIKFTDQGRVTLSVTQETNSVDMHHLKIQVQDTGVGIAPEQIGRLFQPFQQGNSSVARTAGGTGLGLVISRRLAMLMGGGVSLVRSHAVGGSVFEIRVPLDPVAGGKMVTKIAESASPAVPDAGQLTRPVLGRVLLAEDGLDNQRLLGFILRRAGMDVEIANDGVEAWDMIHSAERQQQPYEILLTDISMPRMDGHTLTRRLRAAGSTMPIVALTAHAMAEDRQRALDAGCDDFATKPINKASLLNTCRRWIGGRAGRPAHGPEADAA